MIRRTLRILTALALVLPFASSPAFAAGAPTPLKVGVGVAGGVDEQIWEVVTQVAKKDGLDVEAMISGTASSNDALNNGEGPGTSVKIYRLLTEPLTEERNAPLMRGRLPLWSGNKITQKVGTLLREPTPV